MPHLTPLFARLSRAPCEVSSGDMDQIERFVVLSYQRISALNQVNEARLHLFTQNRKMNYIPPTFHALEQHLKRLFIKPYLETSVWLLTLNFHRQVYGVGTRQLITIREPHAGLPSQRQLKLAKNC